MAACTKRGSGDVSVNPPPLMWAQRKDKVWITVSLENCDNPYHEFKEKTFTFRGKGGTDKLDHEVTLDLFGEIVPESSKFEKSDRQIFFTLMKKDPSTTFWPRLTAGQMKLHFLKTDFNKWKDEDESDDEEKEDFNLDSMMNSMGGLNGGDLGFGAPAAEEEEDSDDEDLPDLQ